LFSRAWAHLAAHLQANRMTDEINDEARNFNCDPLRNERGLLQQALTDLMDDPLRKQLAENRFQPGDRMRGTNYAASLIFTEIDGDAQ
jgi:hypothetical protein